jgi:hypothetical protein
VRAALCTCSVLDVLLLLGILWAPVRAQEAGAPLDIGSRLELFVDEYLIDTMDGVTRKLHSPEPREIVMEFDRPWEGACALPIVIFQDGDIFRMFYRGLSYDEAADTYGDTLTCYAESRDGIHWERPNLGLVEYQGSKDNNFVPRACVPFIDTNPNCPPEQKYKAVADGPINVLASPDCFHWTQLNEDPVVTEGLFDSINLAFWDSVRGEYRMYIRDWTGEGYSGIRQVRTCTSKDFLHWTRPERCKYGDTPLEHLYTNATIPYFRAPHIFLSFPMRLVDGRQVYPHRFDGVSDAVFMSSRDGVNFDRSFMEAWIRPGLDRKNWVCRNIIPTWTFIQTGPDELSFYWEENYYLPGCKVRRGTLRLDGFVSVNAKYAGGEFTTKPLTFEGKELVINYSTSAVGSVRVEIQNADGTPIEGFRLEQCPEIYGDEIERVVAWNGGSDVSGLAGQPVRLRFVMKDADLYSIRFRP